LLKDTAMKPLKFKIIGLFMAGGLLLSTFSVSAQEKEMTRMERKELKKAQMEASFNALDSLLSSRRFVLVADFLQNKYGDRIPVSQTINFIRVNGTTGVIQTGSPWVIGYNGLGGVTAEGTLMVYKMTKNFKSRSYTVRFTISSQIGHYDVLLTVNAANYASATITGTTPGRLTWEGHLEGLGYSKVFKGQNTI
jgi:hypothetical protein